MRFETIRFVGGPLADTARKPDRRDQCLVASVPGHPRHCYVRTSSESGVAVMTWYAEAALTPPERTVA